MSPVMVSGLDPPNTGVWHSNMERARLRSFPEAPWAKCSPCPVGTEDCHRQSGARASGRVKTATAKIGRRAVYGVSGSQRPQKALNARKRRQVDNRGQSNARPNPLSPQHYCCPKPRTENPRCQAESGSHIPVSDGGPDWFQSINPSDLLSHGPLTASLSLG